jgi:hypothetical protein
MVEDALVCGRQQGKQAEARQVLAEISSPPTREATKMKGKRLLTTVAVLWVWGMFVYGGSAQTEMDRKSLGGLQGIGVVVEDLQPDAERDGLTKSQIKTDVELKLRQAGIRVLTIEESFKVPGSPYLYVNVNTSKNDVLYGAFSTYAFSLQVVLKQDVTLARDSDLKVSATTWETHTLGTVAANNLQDTRRVLGDVIDRFINDYLAENPK